MPDERTAFRAGESPTGSGTHQVFAPQPDLRPANQYLTEVTDDEHDYCVMLCSLPQGAVVPLHSHADRETFYVIAGNPDVFMGDHWETLSPGKVADARNGIRHAWRNSSEAKVSMLCVTTMRMARFLRDVAVDMDSPALAVDAQRFLRLVRENGYWLAGPDENAAIGLQVHWGDHPENASSPRIADAK
jgi:quercetin dioxygenase-like cupin family protein